MRFGNTLGLILVAAVALPMRAGAAKTSLNLVYDKPAPK